MVLTFVFSKSAVYHLPLPIDQLIRAGDPTLEGHVSVRAVLWKLQRGIVVPAFLVLKDLGLHLKASAFGEPCYLHVVQFESEAKIREWIAVSTGHNSSRGLLLNRYAFGCARNRHDNEFRGRRRGEAHAGNDFALVRSAGWVGLVVTLNEKRLFGTCAGEGAGLKQSPEK